jgi:hypothetical protein
MAVGTSTGFQPQKKPFFCKELHGAPCRKAPYDCKNKYMNTLIYPESETMLTNFLYVTNLPRGNDVYFTRESPTKNTGYLAVLLKTDSSLRSPSPSCIDTNISTQSKTESLGGRSHRGF